tara:strand:+ start:1221 stop:1634 length:414 start_codon:yes stop_codon:yes gene_type:complete
MGVISKNTRRIIMADFRMIKNVLSGSAEYTFASSTSSGAFNAGDKIQFVFDNDFTIDDMVISALDSGTFVWKARLFYPTGHSAEIADATVSSNAFVLNDNDSSRNMWFRISKWTVLELELIENASTGAFQVSVVGRG